MLLGKENPIHIAIKETTQRPGYFRVVKLNIRSFDKQVSPQRINVGVGEVL